MNNLIEELYKNNEIKKIQQIQFILSKVEKYEDDITIQILFNYSCYLKYYDIIRYLLEYDKTINIHIKEEGPFRMACRDGFIELLDILIEYGEKNNDRINMHIEQYDAIKWALYKKQVRVVQYLINYGEKINERYDLIYIFNKIDHYEFYKSDEMFEYMIYLNRHNNKFISRLKLNIIWDTIILHKYVKHNTKKPLYIGKYIFNNNITKPLNCYYDVIDATMLNYILYI